MMDKNEAVKKLSTVGRLSMSYAEDLYDSFFEKPVVPQFVADWYEENKEGFEINLFCSVCEVGKKYGDKNLNDFGIWLNYSSNNPIQTLVNMHQFGYEVEKEKRYTVRVNAILGQYLERYYLDNEILTPQFKRTQYAEDEAPSFTRKELETNGFGWVFDCPGVEVKEVE